MRRAFITGITGQDGSYLAEWLLEQGYEVHGLVRPGSRLAGSNVGPLLHREAGREGRLRFYEGDLADGPSLKRALREAGPEEVYHLAAQSHVGRSADLAETTCEVTGMGTLRLLQAVRTLGLPCRILHASSSEIFGQPEAAPQDERTPIQPVTVYGCAKAFGTHLVRTFRKSFGLFCVNAILYNHESPRRGESFVTQKICRAAAAIKQGRQQELRLGNTTAQRDWGAARDYVRGMWLALQQEVPDDFIFATGTPHSVQDVVEVAFAAAGLDWREHVRQDPALVRAQDPARLVGNPTRAAERLGWRPTTPFRELVEEMTRHALRPPRD